MGRDLDQVLSQYINSVKPAFEEFTLPVKQGQRSLISVYFSSLTQTKKYADVIIPRGAENSGKGGGGYLWLLVQPTMTSLKL